MPIVSKSQTKNQGRSFVAVIFDTVGWPLFAGVSLCTIFYLLIRQGVIQSELVNRYFASHPIEYAEAALFFVGLSALLLRLADTVGQLSSLNMVELSPRPENGQPIAEAGEMAVAIQDLPAYLRKSYLAQRLLQALQHVSRNDSADGLDEHLKYLSDMDAVHQHDGYALARIIIWATPMLGFLGTVIGITLALGDLSPQALVEAPEQAMQGLLAGLSVAFDTTAVALCLSIFLMFLQYLANLMETELLLAVDRRTTADLVGRFARPARESDASLSAIRRMTQLVMDTNQQSAASLVDAVQQTSDAVIESNREASEGIAHHAENLVKRQSEVWQNAYDESQSRWIEVVDGLRDRLAQKLDDAFYHSFSRHAERLEQTEQETAERMSNFWQRIQDVLTENARVMNDQQMELVRQGDQLLKATSSAKSGDTPSEVLSQLALAIDTLNTRLTVVPRAAQRERAA